jgi:hypothetical protein
VRKKIQAVRREAIEPTTDWEEIMRRQFVFLAVALSILLGSPSTSKANSVVIAQCLWGHCIAAFPTAYSPTYWSARLLSFELARSGYLSFLGLGKSVSLVATQFSGGIMELGQITVTFYELTNDAATNIIATDYFPSAYSGGFAGQFHSSSSCSPVRPCETDTLGMFSIPPDSGLILISGSFGNSVSATTAQMEVSLVSVPGPVVGAGFPGAVLGGAVLVAWWHSKRRAQALA